MFDPIIENIIKLIDTEIHLGNGNCFVILMVGRFSESKYLQSRIKQESSSKVKLIFIPPQPSVAIIKGVENSLYEEEKILQDEIHNNIKQYKLLYNRLQKKYTGLTDKNKEQHQSQEQMIDLLRQTLELKENQIQNFEKEKEELDTKIELVRNQMKNLEKEKDEEINKYKLMSDKYKVKYMELLNKNNEKTN
ncbi:hypothetical protein RhiirC2_781874 [Rhizophagus irregularis]|uniref:Uncharacterized protein n=1 Tax=Rhizophagus irregularis TaxID=588596 RepID=A0A2N1MIC1_9GLOM|nr:hypothetical protein RhiirC2_791872 [Rhizophagus irregularis]PKK68732.1 hypothetical protein RhiirC2_781874 [Rhizophagus irregularis]